MKQKRLLAGVLLCALLLPLAVYAATPMKLVITTPTRMPQALDKSIADTTVLNEQEIRNSGATDLPSLLHFMMGVEVVQSGGLGKVNSTFMRGTNANHVLVLLDGVRINSATVGTTALEHIMLDSIERIEVVRGNVSSLYGSEAIGGVIQLFTKRGKGAPSFSVNAGLGSHGTKRLAEGFSGRVGANAYSVNIGKVKTDGVSAIDVSKVPAANPDKDGYDNTTFNAQVQHFLNDNHQLSASLFSTHGDSQYDSAFNLAPTDRNSTQASIEKLSLASDNQFSEMWHSKLSLTRGTDNSKDYLNDVEQSQFKTVNKQYVWQNELKLADAQHINLAVEHLSQLVDSGTLFTTRGRSVNSVLGGYVGEYGAQQVQFNLRQDRYSDFGIENTGLLGYGLFFADSWRVTANISNAFKAPTFNDMYFPLSFGFSGNPNLKPERARNSELGLHYEAHERHVDAVYFDNRVRDLIAINSTFSSMTNIGEARMNGYELGYAGVFGNTHVKASATIQNPRDASTGKVLLRRAKQYGSIRLSQYMGSWTAGVELQYSGERQDSGAKTLSSYQLANVNAVYKMNKHFDLTMRVNNLFDKDYAEVYSYNTLGKTLFVGLSYR